MGPANAHAIDPVSMVDQAMAGPFAIPPIPPDMPERVSPSGMYRWFGEQSFRSINHLLIRCAVTHRCGA